MRGGCPAIFRAYNTLHPNDDTHIKVCQITDTFEFLAHNNLCNTCTKHLQPPVSLSLRLLCHDGNDINSKHAMAIR